MALFFQSNDVKQDKQARSLSYYFTKDVAYVNQDMIAQLIEESAQNGNCNARICLHTSPDANFHEMIIMEYRDKYFRPHKHLEKGESCHIIQGEVAMFAFDDMGHVTHSHIVGRNGNMICRVGIDQWHTVVPLTEYAIYHESKPGPFLGASDSIYPEWAPDGTDKKDALLFMESLIQCAEERL
jgi:cupin fold WbuC family metalloprotein